MKQQQIFDVHLILPKDGVFPNFGALPKPLYFLAGPIRGAAGGYGAWQDQAIRYLAKYDPGCFIACPCRWTAGDFWYDYKLPPTMQTLHPEKPLTTYTDQTSWERYYLDIASYYGAIIFWLPCEDTITPRSKDAGPYAQDTYGEIARWSIKSAHPDYFSLRTGIRSSHHVRVVIGADPAFPGLATIQKNWAGDHKTPPKGWVAAKQWTTTLEATVREAVNVATQ